MTPGPNVIKLFYGRNLQIFVKIVCYWKTFQALSNVWEWGVLLLGRLPGKPSLPNLMFVGKARSLSESRAPLTTVKSFITLVPDRRTSSCSWRRRRRCCGCSWWRLSTGQTWKPYQRDTGDLLNKLKSFNLTCSYLYFSQK